jgi:CheY-like chemotaxis protein
MPGTQLVNRLQDLRYRVQVVEAAELQSVAASAGAMLIVADLVAKRADMCGIIRQLRLSPATAHLPVIAFADEIETELLDAGKAAGATLVASDAAIGIHLHQLIEQALQVE